MLEKKIIIKDFFSLNNKFKIPLQNLLKIIMLLKTVFKLKLFYTKHGLKNFFFKNLEVIYKKLLATLVINQGFYFFSKHKG